MRSLEDACVELLDSADDTVCTDDLIVVSKDKLRQIAALVCDQMPEWLS